MKTKRIYTKKDSEMNKAIKNEINEKKIVLERYFRFIRNFMINGDNEGLFDDYSSEEAKYFCDVIESGITPFLEDEEYDLRDSSGLD